MANEGEMPVIVLPEGSFRATGRDAARLNILAARTVAEVVKSTLGPKGMDKMLVDSMGDIVVTNDGVTILSEMEIEHPTAKMMVEVAKSQQSEIGDGTTTAVLVAGTLLKNAEELIDQKIHPTSIVKGFQLAKTKAQEILDEISMSIDPDDKETLKKIAKTAMTGKGVEGYKDHLAELAVEAIDLVKEKDTNGRWTIDKDSIKIEKKEGGAISDSELVKGIVIDKERSHVGMPKWIDSARIALINSALEVKDTETDAEIRITDPTQLEKFLQQEEQLLRKMVNKIKETGANVVFCQKGIDDLVQHFLSKEGIYACSRVKKSDMEKLAKATGGRIVTNLDDLSPEDLGSAKTVSEERIAGDEMTFIRDCQNPKAVTLLIRGGTKHVVEEAEKAIEDAVDDLTAAYKGGSIVAGGGATEIEIAKRLREYAESVGGREQLAINAFADAMESCPRTLAENAGYDPIDKLVALKNAHSKPDGRWYGLDVFTGDIVNMMEKEVIEPTLLKKQAIKSAAEVAELVLRIDDIVIAKELKEDKSPGAGNQPAGGMGGF